MSKSLHKRYIYFTMVSVIFFISCIFGSSIGDFRFSTFEEVLQSFLNTWNLPEGSSNETLAVQAYALFFLYNRSPDPRLRERAHETLNQISSLLPRAVYEVLVGMEKWAYDGYPLSKEHFKKAVEMAPSDWWTHFQMMLYHYEVWKRTEATEYRKLALESAEKVLSLNPMLSYTYVVEMDVLSGIRYSDKERLYQIYRIAAERVPNSPVLWRESLKIFYEMGDYENAVDCALRLAESGEMDEESRFMLAYSWWILGEGEKAYNTLMETDLNALKAEWRSTAYDILGSIEEDRGNLQKAIEFYSQAIRFDKNNVSAFKHLGLAYLKTNLERKDAYARYYLGIAQKLYPKDETVNEVLSELHKRIILRVVLTIILPIVAVIIGLLLLVEKFMRPRERLR